MASAWQGEILLNGKPVPALPPPKKTTGGQPTSFAAGLDGIAAWMDAADKILVRRGEKKTLSDGKVQAGLRRAARALRLDPTLDALMMDAMLNGPDTDLPDDDEDPS